MKGSLCPEAQGLRARRHRPPHEPILTPAVTTRQNAWTVMAPPNAQNSEDQSSVILPPLLALPLEIKLQILSNFDDDTDDVENGLTLMVLRRTHKSFRQIIPNPGNRASPGRKQRSRPRKHLLVAERKDTYLFPWHCGCWESTCRSKDCPEPYFMFFPCQDCGWLEDRNKFKNYELAYSILRSATSWDLIGGEHAEDRLCADCWRYQLYGHEEYY